ncbi:MAG TPA: diaminopimelate epimerase [Pirellulales bacterium]|jgi:diaminopimelate epimerase|nr:diaminopimelate epimerase [Pirellulales bacterium]
MRFTKMQGAGNDYVYVDCFAEPMRADPATLARRIADRHYGVGGDGLILICPSSVADARMRMFNADGSESEMCGNGVRCVAKYVYDHGIAQRPTLKIETGRGVLALDVQILDGLVDQVRVDMGEPILELPKIPVDPAQVSLIEPHQYRLPLTTPTLKIAGPATFASMGNPHVVFYVAEVAKVALEAVGPEIETSSAFPNRINVHFVQVHSPDELTMRTWERGSGITLACGTGASAVCVAGVLTGRTARRILAHLPGGDLQLEWSEATNHVFMTGPAVEVFSGDYEL